MLYITVSGTTSSWAFTTANALHFKTTDDRLLLSNNKKNNTSWYRLLCPNYPGISDAFHFPTPRSFTKRRPPPENLGIMTVHHIKQTENEKPGNEMSSPTSLAYPATACPPAPDVPPTSTAPSTQANAVKLSSLSLDYCHPER